MEKLKRLKSLLIGVAWQSPISNPIKICPRCGSKNIKIASKLDGWLTPERYVCNDCGYIGQIVLEVEEERDEEKGG